MPLQNHSQSPGPARLCVMISGGGRTLLNLLSHTRARLLNAEVALVIASKESPGALRARELDVPVKVLPGQIPAHTLQSLLSEHRIDWVVLAGYLHLVNIPPTYQGKVINIHPALLPKFGGQGMYGNRVHQAVLDARERTSGCTVHFADSEYDKGRIILQRSCAVYDSDTAETLGARVHELELEAYPAALKQLIEGKA